MGYWSQINQKKKQYKANEKIRCNACGKEIQLESLPRLRYGVGFICKECSDKRWKARIIK